MSNDTTTMYENACPEEVLALLPWFAEDTLEDAERGLVEVHLAGCRECRDELKMIEGEHEALAAEIPSAERMYGLVRERIEEAEGGKVRTLTRRAPPRRARVFVRRERWLAIAAGAAVALLAGSAWLVSLDRERAGQPTYQTANARSVAVAAEGPQLDVIFRPEATAGRINEVLRAIGGTVVDGPAEFERYRIQLSDRDADPVAVAKILRSGLSEKSGTGSGAVTTHSGDAEQSRLVDGVAVFAELVLE